MQPGIAPLGSGAQVTILISGNVCLCPLKRSLVAKFKHLCQIRAQYRSFMSEMLTWLSVLKFIPGAKAPKTCY